MARFLFILIISLATVAAHAKLEIKGKVTDDGGNPLPGIMLRLYQGDKIKAYTTTRKGGIFHLTADSLTFPAKITFSSKSYAPLEKWISNTTDSVHAVLEPEEFTLNEVVVKVPHARVKGDTITYDVASYTAGGDRNIEDVIRKLPGVEVNDNGTIMYDGAPINNFYIEGLNLMEGNYAVASRNISPEDISTVSVYERHQSTKALKGIAHSDRAALNLKLKKGRMLKPVGYVKGGAGFGDETLWSGNIYTMLISPKNQTILSANGNNTGNDCLPKEEGADNSFSVFSRTPFGTPSVTASRYMKNKSAYATANTLFKLREGMTMTFNSSYGLDHDGFDGKTVTEYLASSLHDPVYAESVDNGMRRHAVEASVKFENNTDRLYLKDKVDFKGYFNRNGYGIENTSSISQTLHNRHFSFSNDFSTVIRRGDNAIQVTSETSFRLTPFNNIAATDIVAGSSIMRQNVSGRSFRNHEKTGYTFRLSRLFSAGSDLEFKINNDSFESYGEKGEATPACNDVSGHLINAALSPFFSFTIPGKLQARIVFPVEWENLKFTDIISEKVHRSDKLFFNGNFMLFFRPHPYSWFNLTAGWDHSTGDIRNFIDNPVFTTFRNTTTLGNGSLVETLTKSANLAYSYRNPLDGFYLRAMASYSRKLTNSLSVYNVDSEGTSGSSLNTRTHNSITNLMVNATKLIRPIGTNLSLNLTGVWMQMESMRSSLLINVRNATYMAILKADTEQLGGILRVSANLSYSLSHQSFGGILPTNDIREFGVNGRVSLFPVKALEVYGRAYFNRSQLADHNYKSNLFIDAGAIYSFNKFELELAARNLTDMRQYAYTLYHSLDISSYSYSLRPIEAVITLRYRF